MRRHTTNFKNITRNPTIIAKIFATSILKPIRCQFCENTRIYKDYCPVEQWEHKECFNHILAWLERAAK